MMPFVTRRHLKGTLHYKDDACSVASQRVRSRNLVPKSILFLPVIELRSIDMYYIDVGQKLRNFAHFAHILEFLGRFSTFAFFMAQINFVGT